MITHTKITQKIENKNLKVSRVVKKKMRISGKECQSLKDHFCKEYVTYGC